MQEFQKNQPAGFLNILEQFINLPFNREIVLRIIEEVVEEFMNNTENRCSQRFFNELTEKLSEKLDELKQNLQFRDKRIRKSIEMLENKFHLPLKINEIADEVGMNEKSLMRLFIRTTGKSMGDYLTDIRISQAMKLLRESDDTIEGIAYTCGYNSSRYFCMAFSKSEGISPGEFRKKG